MECNTMRDDPHRSSTEIRHGRYGVRGNSLLPASREVEKDEVRREEYVL